MNCKEAFGVIYFAQFNVDYQVWTEDCINKSIYGGEIIYVDTYSRGCL